MADQVAKMVAFMQEGNFRMARNVLRKILKSRKSVKLGDSGIKDSNVDKFLYKEFNKYSREMNASFWQTKGCYPDLNRNEYEFKILSDKEAFDVAEVFIRVWKYESSEVAGIDWNLLLL